FVAHPKMVHRAGGLARLLETARRPDVSIQVLDKRVAAGGRRIRADLGSGGREPLLRLAALLSPSGERGAAPPLGDPALARRRALGDRLFVLPARRGQMAGG